MSGEQILLLVILAFAIFAAFYVAEDIRDAFRDPYGDSPFIHPEMRKGEAGRETRAGGRDSGKAPRLGDRRTRHKRGNTP